MKSAAAVIGPSLCDNDGPTPILNNLRTLNGIATAYTSLGRKPTGHRPVRRLRFAEGQKRAPTRTPNMRGASNLSLSPREPNVARFWVIRSVTLLTNTSAEY